jgi:ATP-dependent helicase/nuclease subunit B
MSIFRLPSPRLFTIASGIPFLDALADGIEAEAGSDALALSRVTVLLPTRRACRALRDTFLRRSDGRPTLLPRLRPIGDVDDDELALAGGEELEQGGDLDLPPAIQPLRRRLMLARAILKLAAAEGDIGPPQAIDLSAELAHLLDQVQTERLSFERLAKLVPDELAEHWRRTIDFLKILTEAWPKILETEGAIDPAERRNRALAALARHWTEHPPAGPVYAAGSTGSIPATADLLGVIARLPQGAVVLPGLDRDLDAESWAKLDETHPQFGLRQLLERLQIDRAAVREWPHGAEAGAAAARRGLLSAALRPAATTAGWQAMRMFGSQSVADIARIDCAHPQQEAQVIALLLREALEVEGRTAALITPDRDLARRVAAELGRFGIAIDDSAGRPLGATPPMTFLRLVAEVACEGVAPAPLLAAFKHPLAAGGLAPVEFRANARLLELAALRGPRPAGGFDGLIEALRASRHREARELAPWLTRLGEQAREMTVLAAGDASPADLVRAHVRLAEAWAASDAETGTQRLWAGEAGEAAAAFMAELADAARDLEPIRGRTYPALLEACLAGRVIRPTWGGHPRLQILGPLEARLIGVDLAILGGLNEGTWPQDAEADPWMSRPMRASFGLSAPERRVGLSAHDFVQACGAPSVVMTRALRVEGTPTVPSRWLQRLDAVLEAAGLESELARRPELIAWQAWLDETDRQVPAGPPAPRPPVKARPRRLSVTEIEKWRRDPYVIYARHVLKLHPLEPLDADPGAADRGIVIHDALAEFVKAYPAALPADALDRLLDIGRRRFGPMLSRPGVWAFWWPRFEAIARWFITHDAERRRGGVVPIGIEATGGLAIPARGGEFTLAARADRIDRLPDGTLAIIDYKTGAPPDTRAVMDGFAPQLPLEAAIAAVGGFRDVPAAAVSQLRHWRLSGGNPPGEECPIDGAKLDRGRTTVPEPMILAEQAMVGVKTLVERFDDPATPYHARPWPEHGLRYNDYAHLARIKEWSAVEDER